MTDQLTENPERTPLGFLSFPAIPGKGLGRAAAAPITQRARGLAVEACVAEHFPPRVLPLSLMDDVKEWRGRVHNRIVGPSRQLDRADLLMCSNKVRAFADVADDLELDDVPPLPAAPASYEELRAYLSALVKSCERRVAQDAQRQPRSPAAPAGAAVPPTKGKGTTKAEREHMWRERNQKAWDFVPANEDTTLEKLAAYCGCGKSYARNLPAWKELESKRAKRWAEGGGGSAPTTVSFTPKMQAIASRDTDPTQQAVGECASPAPVKLRHSAGRSKRLEGQKLRQKAGDGDDAP